MLTKKQKEDIIDDMTNMKDGEVKLFNTIDVEKKEYIIKIIKGQSGKQNFYFETNGTDSIPSSITKFRKIVKKHISPWK